MISLDPVVKFTALFVGDPVGAPRAWKKTFQVPQESDRWATVAAASDCARSLYALDWGLDYLPCDGQFVLIAETDAQQVYLGSSSSALYGAPREWPLWEIYNLAENPDGPQGSSFDDALKLLQDKFQITDGDVAGQFWASMSSQWNEMETAERVVTIGCYLRTEATIRGIDLPCDWYTQASLEATTQEPRGRCAGNRTFTAFCMESSGRGTTWVKDVTVPHAGNLEATLDLVNQQAVEECAADWGYKPDDVRCWGITSPCVLFQWDGAANQ